MLSREELLHYKTRLRQESVYALRNFDPVEVAEDQGLLRVESRIPADLFNTVQQTRLKEKDVELAIRAIRAGAEDRGVAFMWLLWPDDEPYDLLSEALPQFGFRRDMTCLLMAHPLDDVRPVELPDGVELIAIDQEAQLREYSEVACSAFNWERESWDMGFEWNRHMMRHEHGRKMYAVCEEGRMVAICGGRSVGKLFEVSVIATHSSARNKGYATAMTNFLCGQAQRLGCEAAYLEATEMGAGVYSRIGFNAFDELHEHVFEPEQSGGLVNAH